MSRLLPPSTSAQYTGSPRAPQILAVLAVLTIVPACIHSFLPDGGASRCLRLTLARADAAQIEKGVRALGRVIAERLAGSLEARPSPGVLV